ncbi:unnamed protein product [Prunus armeniaca]
MAPPCAPVQLFLDQLGNMFYISPFHFGRTRPRVIFKIEWIIFMECIQYSPATLKVLDISMDGGTSTT